MNIKIICKNLKRKRASIQHIVLNRSKIHEYDTAH